MTVNWRHSDANFVYKNRFLQEKSGGFDLKKRKIHPAFWVSISVGILFMVLGIWRDEVMVLYQKAIYICMECIGLG